MDQFGMGADRNKQKGEVLRLNARGRKELHEAEKSFEQLVKGVFAPFCGTHEEFLSQFFSVSQISSFVLR
jgi:hypothetical protein